MNHYLVLYYDQLRIRDVFVIPDAKNATDAKRKAAKLQPLKSGLTAGATMIKAVRYPWHVLDNGR